eukprot:s493_g11.t1
MQPGESLHFPRVLRFVPWCQHQDYKVRGLDCMKMWPWMRDLPTSVWAGHGWAFDENGLRRLSSPGGSNAMQDVEVFESVGLAAEEVKPSDEKITEEAPGAAAAAENPLPPSEGQKPSRFKRINVAKQSGIPNVQWKNPLQAWEVNFPKVDSKGNISGKTGRQGLPRRASPTGSPQRAEAKWRVRIYLKSGQKLNGKKTISGGYFTEKAAAEAKALELREKDGLQRRVKPVAALSELPVFHPKVPYPGVTWRQTEQQWRADCYVGGVGQTFRVRPKDHSEAELERSFQVAVAWKKKQEKKKEKEGKAVKSKAKPGKKQRK